jgi:hypothetical protein
MDVMKAVERLNEIREVKKALEEEEKALRNFLEKIVAAAGGRLVVGSYVLTLSTAATYQYGKIVDIIRKHHPELEGELVELSEKFKTTYSRITVERLS